MKPEEIEALKDWLRSPTIGPSSRPATLRAIEALQAENRRLREALTPFVEGYSHTAVFISSRQKMHPAGQDLYREDVDRARQALSESGQ